MHRMHASCASNTEQATFLHQNIPRCGREQRPRNASSCALGARRCDVGQHELASINRSRLWSASRGPHRLQISAERLEVSLDAIQLEQQTQPRWVM